MFSGFFCYSFFIFAMTSKCFNVVFLYKPILTLNIWMKMELVWWTCFVISDFEMCESRAFWGNFTYNLNIVDWTGFGEYTLMDTGWWQLYWLAWLLVHECCVILKELKWFFYVCIYVSKQLLLLKQTLIRHKVTLRMIYSTDCILAKECWYIISRLSR